MHRDTAKLAVTGLCLDEIAAMSGKRCKRLITKKLKRACSAYEPRRSPVNSVSYADGVTAMRRKDQPLAKDMIRCPRETNDIAAITRVQHTGRARQ